MADTHPRVDIVDLDVAAGAIDDARLVLSPDELRRAERFLREKDRARFVAARAWLRRTLGHALAVPPERVAFDYGPHGKPELASPFDESGIRFNLSHSGGRALLAWARGREIGADLEALRPVRYGAQIARRFFSDDEQRALPDPADERWDTAFFRCWTRKEAFIKAIGDGLSYPLRAFTIPMTERPVGEYVRVQGDEVASRRWILTAVDAGENFLAAVVCERGV